MSRYLACWLFMLLSLPVLAGEDALVPVLEVGDDQGWYGREDAISLLPALKHAGRLQSLATRTDRPELFRVQPWMNRDGLFSFVTRPGQTGLARVEVYWLDEQGREGKETLSIRVKAGDVVYLDGMENHNPLFNQAPVLVDPDGTDDGNTVIQAHPGREALLALSATDLENQPLAWSVLRTPTQGSLQATGGWASCSNQCELRYQLASMSSDSFQVEVADTAGGADTLTVQVQAVNTAPVIIDPDGTDDGQTAGTVIAEVSSSWQLDATDADADSLSWSVHTEPVHGQVSFHNANQVVYTVSGNYGGGDSFTLEVSDGFGGRDTLRFDLYVNARPEITEPDGVNDGTVAVDVTVGTVMVLRFTATDLNPTDNLRTYIRTHPAQGGQLSLNTTRQGNPLEFEVRYEPPANATGSDRFTLWVTDDNGALTGLEFFISLLHRLYIVEPDGVNDGLTGAEVEEGQTHAVNLTTVNPAGGVLTWSLSGAAAHGVAQVSAQGQVTYVPTAGYVGPDSFEVQVANTQGDVARLRFDMAVLPFNSAPVITDPDGLDDGNTDAVVDRDGLYVLNLNAVDAENDALTWSIVTAAGHGLASVDAQGQISYSPASGYYGGPDTFTVQVQDPRGLTDTLTFFILVNAKPAIIDPDGNGDGSTTINMRAESTTTLDLDVNDPDDSTHDWTVYEDPASGAARVSLDASTGQFWYIPSFSFTGQDTFVIQVSDGKGATDRIRIYVNVQ